MKKTKIMRISRKEGRKLTILTEGHKLDQVEQFVYLGSLVTVDIDIDIPQINSLLYTKKWL